MQDTPITNLSPNPPNPGYATSQIFMDAFAARFNGNTKPALAFMLILFVASNWCGTFCITANSRMLYAFSRDDGIPGSRWWKRVNPTTGTPINSIIAMGAAAILLGLSLLGSTVAFSAMSSIGVIGMYISYAIPQFLRLTVARKWFKKVGGRGQGVERMEEGWGGTGLCDLAGDKFVSSIRPRAGEAALPAHGTMLPVDHSDSTAQSLPQTGAPFHPNNTPHKHHRAPSTWASSRWSSAGSACSGAPSSPSCLRCPTSTR